MFLTHHAELKDFLETLLHIDRNTLHVHLGLVLFFGLAALIRSRHRFARALVWLAMIAMLNEAFDLLGAYSKGHSLAWGESVADIVNTVLWPAVWVLFGARILGFWRRHTRPLPLPAASSTPSMENPRT